MLLAALTGAGFLWFVRARRDRTPPSPGLVGGLLGARRVHTFLRRVCRRPRGTVAALGRAHPGGLGGGWGGRARAGCDAPVCAGGHHARNRLDRQGAAAEPAGHRSARVGRKSALPARDAPRGAARRRGADRPRSAAGAGGRRRTDPADGPGGSGGGWIRDLRAGGFGFPRAGLLARPQRDPGVPPADRGRGGSVCSAARPRARRSSGAGAARRIRLWSVRGADAHIPAETAVAQRRPGTGTGSGGAGDSRRQRHDGRPAQDLPAACQLGAAPGQASLDLRDRHRRSHQAAASGRGDSARGCLA